MSLATTDIQNLINNINTKNCKNGAAFLDAVYNLSINTNFKLNTIAYGIAFADQTCRIPGSLSLQLRKIPFVKEVIFTLLDAEISSIDDVVSWLNTNCESLLNPKTTVDTYLIGVQKKEVTHRVAYRKFATVKVISVNGENSIAVDCDLSDHCSLDNCYDDLKKAVLWVHKQRAAVGCELS
ncbi:MAG: hypothetical protein ACKPCP_12385, partial [Sphaerospermopsis kisseleviana]